MDLTVARIGRPHGLRGEVALDVRCDDPDARLAPGNQLRTDPPQAGPLTVTRLRSDSGRYIAAFAEVPDRTAAEALRGTALVIEAVAGEEDDAWYPHELAGLRAELTDGRVVGHVVTLVPGAAHDLLEIEQTSGARALVPFVHAIVPVVDTRAGKVVLDPPGGLLEDEPARDEPATDESGTDESGTDQPAPQA